MRGSARALSGESSVRGLIVATVLLSILVTVAPLVSTASTDSNVWTPTSRSALDVLAPDPRNHGVVYGAQSNASLAAGSETGTVYKSVNAGETWAAVGTIDTSMQVTALDVDPDPSHTNTVFAAGFYANTTGDGPPSYGALFKSVDGGEHFAKITLNKPSWVVLDILVAKGNQVVYVARGDHGVFRSANGGVTFSATPDLTTPAGDYFASVLVADPVDPKILYVAGGWGQVFRSVNWGDSWRRLFDTTDDTPAMSDMVTSLAADPHHPEVVYVGLQGGWMSRWGLAKSSDRGGNWSVMNAGLPLKAGSSGIDDGVSSVAVSPTDSDIVYALAGSRFWGTQRPFRSQDGGHTWQTMSLSSSDMQGDLLTTLPVSPPVVLMDGSTDATATSVSRYVDNSWFEVRSPNGGETITGNVTVTAEGTNATTPAAVAFYYTRGIYPGLIGTDTHSADGWQVTWETSWAASGSDYRIIAHMLPAAGPALATDTSDGTFTVNNPVTIPAFRHEIPSAGMKVGGTTLMQARMDYNYPLIINKVKYYTIDASGTTISIGDATKNGYFLWQLNWDTNGGSTPDGVYRAVARAVQAHGGHEHPIATSMSGPFTVRNRPEMHLHAKSRNFWCETATVFGAVDFTTGVTDPVNQIGQVSFYYKPPGGSWTHIWDDVWSSGGWTGWWDTNQPAVTPDGAGYAVKAVALQAGGAPFTPPVEAIREPYRIWNVPVQILYPAEGDYVFMPTQIRTEVRPWVSGSPISIQLHRDPGDHRYNIPGSGWDQRYLAERNKDTGSPTNFWNVTGLVHIQADYGSGEYAESGEFYMDWDALDRATVTPPGGTGAENELNGFIDMNVRLGSAQHPVPNDQLEAVRYHIGPTNSYEDTSPANGFTWRLNTETLAETDYAASVDVKTAGITTTVWSGTYRIHNNRLKAYVTSVEGPPSRPRMKETYHVKVHVYNPDAFSQRVTMSLYETATVDSVASDWLGFTLEPMEYKHQLNGTVLAGRTAKIEETFDVPSHGSHTFDFSIRHDWRWLEASEDLGTGGMIANMGLKGSGWLAARTVSWGTKLKEIFGVVTDVIDAGLRICEVLSGAPAMDYDYKIESSVPNMSGLSPSSYSITALVPDNKPILLFNSYVASDLAGLATIAGLASAWAGPFSLGFFAIEAANIGIAYFSADAAKDPDPNYRTKAPPPLVTVPELTDVPDGAVKDAAEDSLSFVQHLRTAEQGLARSEGAAEAGDRYWEILQLKQAESAMAGAAVDLSGLASGCELISENAQAEGQESTVEDVLASQAEIAEHGLPPMERRILGDFGLSESDIDGLEQRIAVAGPEELADEEAIWKRYAQLRHDFTTIKGELGWEKQEMASEVTFAVSGPSVVNYPSKVRLAGYVGLTAPMTLTVWGKASGARAYGATGVLVHTTAQGGRGVFAASLALSKNTYFKFYWPDGGVWLGGSRLVKVAPKLTLSGRRYGGRIRLSGAISPRHTRRLLTVYRPSGRRWVRWATVRTNRLGGYSIYLRAPRRVKARVRFGGDTDHTPSYSPSRTL